MSTSQHEPLHHHHHHHHDGSDSTSLAEKNEKYWSSVSKTAFTEPWVKALQLQIATTLTANLRWLGISTAPYAADSATPRRLLDYACGSGLPSRTLAPYFNQLVGMDLSAAMLTEYTAAAESADIPNAAARFTTVHGDLMAAPAADAIPSLTGLFDMAVICMALHHISDAPRSLARLAAQLRPGGVLLVIDWVTEEEDRLDQMDGPAAHTIAHHSFSKKQMAEAFETAGCAEGFAFMELPEKSEVPRAKGGVMQMFFARGTKTV
ncbi:S-adenosyl-L-methionine-dependent methyltransferase [Geopyxis carbonaria]|nr:S-adenosyl-L-methionine-dependent methyltransferase [Geopyxis carbonaria]